MANNTNRVESEIFTPKLKFKDEEKITNKLNKVNKTLELVEDLEEIKFDRNKN